MRSKILILGLLASVLAGRPAFAATYAVDGDHTTVSFKIRHLFSNVQGQFTKFDGTVDYDPAKPETWNAAGFIDAASIDTKVPERDKHLRSKDFFDVEKFPKITFKAAKITPLPGGAKVEGLLNIHGVEKPVTLEVEIHGVGKDPWGNTRAGFTATTKINRKDFGLTWNKALDAGGFLVGDEVLITLEIEGLAKA